eukprot:TRINITY_DN55480_c0_g1_i1.p2 TRINITY_DN55480_c0_g1~~TRINITY_DN55480_c0_g1_i1.p2  ORF type:complete len:156 (+),score=9.37 TRINITY_DN55480_c0_g1_i1:83-550(+)
MIFKFTKDMYYYKYKTKENSLRLNSRGSYYHINRYVGIKENGEFVWWEKYSQCINAMKLRYGPQPLEYLLNQSGRIVEVDSMRQDIELQHKTLQKLENEIGDQGTDKQGSSYVPREQGTGLEGEFGLGYFVYIQHTLAQWRIELSLSGGGAFIGE